MVTKVPQTGIADLAVGQSQLASDSVTSGKIVDGSVDTADLAVAARPALTKAFESAQQSITAGGLLTLAHGLAVAPKMVTAELVCATGELNWVAGDRQFIACGPGADAASNRGIAVYHDATNVYVRYGSAASPLVINNRTTGATAAMTIANWMLVIRAWA